jgi:hypothetical protein
LNEVRIVLHESILHEGLCRCLNNGVEIRRNIRLMAVHDLTGIVLLIDRTMIIHVLMRHLIRCIDRVTGQGDVRILKGDIGASIRVLISDGRWIEQKSLCEEENKTTIDYG